MMRRVLWAAASLALAGCSTVAHSPQEHPEAAIYAADIDAAQAVDAALAQAGATGRNALIVMGANWCHDSRAFAGWMQTPRFKALIAERFVVAYINVGMPQTGDGHNLHIARRFGLEGTKGTPTVLVAAPDGTLLNPDTAGTWRNAASRSADAIHAQLSSFPLPADFTPS